jgi:hypothetical protein
MLRPLYLHYLFARGETAADDLFTEVGGKIILHEKETLLVQSWRIGGHMEVIIIENLNF